MEIVVANSSDKQELYEFNTRMYPEKSIDSKRYLDFWLSKSPDAIERVLLIKDDFGRIVGQNILSEMFYHYQGVRVDSVWGFDLIIEEQYRKGAWGIDLMLKNKEINPKTLATGSGPTALPINLKLGMKMLGEIRKYVGIISPLWLPFCIGKGHVNENKYPEIVKVGDISFLRVGMQDYPVRNEPYNSSLLEIGRDKQFLEWRYNNNLHDYVFYREEGSDNFFVLRTTVIKHVTALILVDYRCDANAEKQFEDIIKAVKKVGSAIHVPILITGSSLSAFNKVLERNHLKSIGRPRPILGFLKCKDRKEDIAKRNFCLVTLADSDGETNWV